MSDDSAHKLGLAVQGLRGWLSALWRMEAGFRGVRMQGQTTFYGRPAIYVAPGSTFELGDGVVFSSATRANLLGCFQPCVLRTLASGARLVIANNVGMSATVICAGKEITIGEGTILGSGAMILDNDFHAPEGDFGWRNECVANARPVRIGRGVFIGARAIILKGVTIGDRAVIGAGAVVAKDVPAGATAAGNPARVVKPGQPD